MANDVKVIIKALLNDKDFQKGLKKIDKGVGKTGKKQAGFFKKMKVGWLAMAAGVGLFAVAIGKALKVSVVFEKAIDKVVSVAGEGKEALSALAREAGKNTVFSATEAADALFFLASAGLAVKDMAEVLEPALNLASAGQLTVAESTDLLVNNLKVFGAAMSDAEKFTDIMASATKNANTDMAQLSEALKSAGPIASTAGIDFKELNVILAAMADRGIKGGVAGIQLRQAIARLTKPTREAKDALAKYGITTEEITKLLPTPIKLFKRMNEAGLSNADALAIFGVRQSGITALIKDGIPSLDRLNGAMEDYAGTSKEMADIQIDNVAGALALLKSGWEELILTVTTGVLPGLKNIVLSLTENVRLIATWLNLISEANKQLGNDLTVMSEFNVKTEEQAQAVRDLANAYEKWADANKTLETFEKTLARINEEQGSAAGIEFMKKYSTVAGEAQVAMSALGVEMDIYKEKLVDTMITSGAEALVVMDTINAKKDETIAKDDELTANVVENDLIETESTLAKAETKKISEEQAAASLLELNLAVSEATNKLKEADLLKEQIRIQKEIATVTAANEAFIGLESEKKLQLELLNQQLQDNLNAQNELTLENNRHRQNLSVDMYGTSFENISTKQQAEIEKMRLAQNELWDEISEKVENVVDKNVDDWSTGIADMVVEGEFFGATLGSIFKQLLKDLAKMIIKMAAAKAAKAVLTGGVGLFFSEGGVVPKYMSNGGKIAYAAEGMEAKGTDTVPAMLTPGERVLSVADNSAFEQLMSGLNIPANNNSTGLSNTTNNNQQDNRSISMNNETVQGETFDGFFDKMTLMNVNMTRR